MAEALAVALITNSTIVVSTDSELLRDCAEDLGVAYHLLSSPPPGNEVSEKPG